ncbi:FxsA family protein [Paenibacillus pasadenensis]|uniref:Cytoplasmic membrane protein FsxA n=1 Tax=Paenibacillus pasadenensis TaxID=217090 RepID=A0A2N5N9K3_9BACL|nr:MULTISPECIES: FxsA family protein [Paenibacillus]PLT46995.1 Cytoplasmic membrane protein FsxA [Paenibacillus pasadenensis]QGG57334.1 membrane protein FxsA [Paenibacillus sp. B01]
MNRRLGTVQKALLGGAAYVLLEVIAMAWLGSRIGVGGVFLLLVGTAVLGTVLMRTHGRKAWAEMRRKMELGEPPGHALLNGLCLMAGSLLLIFPGVIGDLVGLTLVLPVTRGFYRLRLYRLLERLLRRGGGGGFGGPGGGRFIFIGRR